jgi:hypothetical protein
MPNECCNCSQGSNDSYLVCWSCFRLFEIYAKSVLVSEATLPIAALPLRSFPLSLATERYHVLVSPLCQGLCLRRGGIARHINGVAAANAREAALVRCCTQQLQNMSRGARAAALSWFGIVRLACALLFVQMQRCQ